MIILAVNIEKLFFKSLLSATNLDTAVCIPPHEREIKKASTGKII